MTAAEAIARQARGEEPETRMKDGRPARLLEIGEIIERTDEYQGDDMDGVAPYGTVGTPETGDDPRVRRALPAAPAPDQPATDAPETLRDRFAMAALTGLVPCCDRPESDPAMLAQWAYAQADAMLAARKAVEP